MKKLMRLIQQEWEKSLFWILLACLIGSFALWILPNGEDDSGGRKGQAKTRQSLLGEEALAFLEPTKMPRMPTGSPFGYQYTPPKKIQWGEGGGVKTTKKVNVKTKVEPETGTQTVTTTVKADPQKPLASRVVEYKGIYISTTGKRLASVSLFDPASKKRQGGFWQVGRKQDGIEVEDFSEDSLFVLDPKGQRKNIPKGKKKKIIIE